MTDAVMRLDFASWIGEARPTKVENCCLLKAPVKMVSGLPPLVQIDCSVVFSCASVKARCVPSVRVPVPSAAEGSAAPPAEPLDVLLLIQERTEAVAHQELPPEDSGLGRRFLRVRDGHAGRHGLHADRYQDGHEREARHHSHRLAASRKTSRHPSLLQERRRPLIGADPAST